MYALECTRTYVVWCNVRSCICSTWKSARPTSERCRWTPHKCTRRASYSSLSRNTFVESWACCWRRYCIHAAHSDHPPTSRS